MVARGHDPNCSRISRMYTEASGRGGPRSRFGSEGRGSRSNRSRSSAGSGSRSKFEYEIRQFRVEVQPTIFADPSSSRPLDLSDHPPTRPPRPLPVVSPNCRVVAAPHTALPAGLRVDGVVKTYNQLPSELPRGVTDVTAFLHASPPSISSREMQHIYLSVLTPKRIR